MIIATKSIGNFGYVQDIPLENLLSVLVGQACVLTDGFGDKQIMFKINSTY